MVRKHSDKESRLRARSPGQGAQGKEPETKRQGVAIVEKNIDDMQSDIKKMQVQIAETPEGIKEIGITIEGIQNDIKEMEMDFDTRLQVAKETMEGIDLQNSEEMQLKIEVLQKDINEIKSHLDTGLRDGAIATKSFSKKLQFVQEHLLEKILDMEDKTEKVEILGGRSLRGKGGVKAAQ